MNKQLLVIVLAAFGLTAFLYTRPKSVVKDEAKATRDTPAAAQTATASQDKEAEHEDHSPLTAEQTATVQNLLRTLTKTPNAGKGKIYTQLADIYANVNRFDSAGHYLEQAALLNPSVETWNETADMYFQGFNLALRPENIAALTKKTQETYQKVLDLKPNDLHARTNLAMTYVSSTSPMQAISLLREVIADAPDYQPALLNLGVLSLQSGQFDKAAARFTHVLRLDPKNPHANIGLAYSYIELKKTAEAKKLLEDLLKTELDPTLRQEVSNTLQSLK